MAPKTFFRLAIIFPILLPLLILPFGENILMGLLMMSLAFGGVQYLLFAIWLLLAIGKKQTTEEIKRLSFQAPLVFIPFQLIGLIAWAIYVHASIKETLQLALVFAFYSLLIGYIYVGITNIVFSSCKKIN